MAKPGLEIPDQSCHRENGQIMVINKIITTRNVSLMVSHSSAAVVLRSPSDRFMSEAHTGLIMEQHAHEPEEPSNLWIERTELTSRML
jgi:hypothetical protein